MNPKFVMIRDFYEKGVWSEARVRDAVEKGWINAEEFKTITGKDY